VIITADHGNAEELLNTKTGEIDTEHSLNPVPLIIVDPTLPKQQLPYGALKDVAPTVLNIMGIPLTEEQALNGGLIIHSRYLGVDGWKSTLVPNLDESQSNTFRAGPDFIKDGAITASKLSSEVKTELLTIPVSWDLGSIGDYKIKIPYTCTIVEINAYLTGTIEITNSASLDFKNGSLNSMGSEIFAAGGTIGTGMTTITPSSNNIMSENDANHWFD
jgi:hypothetical protein